MFKMRLKSIQVLAFVEGVVMAAANGICLVKNGFRLLLSAVAVCLVCSVNSALALSWDPSDAGTGLVAWYDASTTNDLTITSGRVDVMLDRSGNGLHLTDPVRNVGDKPDYHTSMINGLGAIYFDTWNGRKLTGIPDIDCTNVCIVSVMMGSSGDSPTAGKVASTDGSDSLEVYESSNTTSGKGNAMVKVDNVGCNTATAYNAALAVQVPHIYAVWYDGSESAGRANGGVVSSANTGAPDGATFTINEIRFGRSANTPKNYVGESVILNIADMDTIEKVEGYLAHKWGLLSALPEDHPYRYSEPDAPIPPAPAGTVIIIR